MSPKASSDFGLYKEKLKENNLKSIKFVVVLVITVLFLLVILYALVHLIQKSSTMISYESNIEKPVTTAEKLVLSQSVKREIFDNPPAKPFGLTYRSQPPSEFTSTTENYPQVKISNQRFTTLNHPVNRYYPHNIQDVIGYATSQPVHKRYRQSSSQKNHRSTKNFTFHDHDPFYFFKPQDPGEINLLATGNFRFAPPLWSNLRKSFPRYQSIKRHEVHRRKPVSVTLNIFPNGEQRGLKHFLGRKIEGLKSRVRSPERESEQMVLRLNLYPDEASESKLHTRVESTTISITP